MTAHENSALCTATFDSVNILPAPTWLSIRGITHLSDACHKTALGDRSQERAMSLRDEHAPPDLPLPGHA